MFVISNLLTAVAKILDIALWAYFYVMIARVLISWVSPDPYNPIVRFLYQATEPVLDRIRRYLPFLVIGGIDLSPWVVMIIIQFLRWFLVSSLFDIAVRMK